MGERQQAISYLTQVKREMAAKREQLFRPVQELDKELEHITAALAVLLRHGEKENKQEAKTDFPLSGLRRLTHRQAVVVIARHNGGTLKAQDAKKILIQAGVMSSTKNSTNMTHNAIIQSGQFDRIGRGEYRLKETKLATGDGGILHTALQ